MNVRLSTSALRAVVLCVATVVAPIALAQPSAADDCRSGVIEQCQPAALDLVDAEQLEQALELFEVACGAGVSEACSRIGNIYRRGMGTIPENLGEAIRYYRLACDGGFAWGCTNAGRQLVREGTLQNYTEAAQLFEIGCQGGLAAACSEWSYLYFDGQGVERNIDRAAELFELACQGGHPLACSNACFFHHTGIDGELPIDLNLARTRCQRACDLGREESCALLNELPPSFEGSDWGILAGRGPAAVLAGPCRIENYYDGDHNVTTDFTYNALGQVVRIDYSQVQPAELMTVIEFFYDAEGQIERSTVNRIRSGSVDEWRFGYRNEGREIAAYEHLAPTGGRRHGGVSLHRWGFDSEGQLISRTKDGFLGELRPDGTPESGYRYEYDVEGRLSQVEEFQTVDTVFEPDEAGGFTISHSFGPEYHSIDERTTFHYDPGAIHPTSAAFDDGGDGAVEEQLLFTYSDAISQACDPHPYAGLWHPYGFPLTGCPERIERHNAEGETVSHEILRYECP